MRKFLAAANGILLVLAVAAAGLDLAAPTSRSADDTPAALARPVRSTGLGAPPAGAAREGQVIRADGAPASGPAPSRSPRVYPVATPARFNVARPMPKVEERLSAQLSSAAPSDQIIVYVHAADAAFARRAAEDQGLTVVASFVKVGVVAAVGSPAAIRALTNVKGLSYLQADRPLEYFQETSHQATRGEEARAGFSVTYDEPQPDKAAAKKRVCTTKKNKSGRVVRNRRGQPVRTCRTVITRSTPQPPIPRTLTSPGVDGSGVTVAIIDSGVDGTHPMFSQGGTSKVVRNLKFVGLAQCSTTLTDCAGEQGNANDSMFVPVPDGDSISLGGHGTHVAGIAAGVDVTTADGKKLHGAAPGAKLVSLSVGTGINVIGADAAVNWVLEHHKDPCLNGSCPPIKVVNNSYGAVGGGEFDPEDVSAKLQRALVLEGVVMVWANGNGDALNVGGDGSDNRSNPTGQDPTPGIISVANYDDGEAANRDNVLDSSSSRGEKGRPSTYPDVSAPGGSILSACRPQLAICRGTTTTDPNYGVIGGTSMAAPHVAGIVAQMLEANPAMTPAEIEDALEDTARPFAFGGSYEPDTTNDGVTSFDKGHGLVDVVGAVARVRMFPVFPAGANTCTADGPVAVDPAGDAREAHIVETPAPNEPALDLLSMSLGWDSSSQTAQFRIRVKDLGERPVPVEGEYFSVFFTHYGAEYRLNGARSVTGAQTYSLSGAAAAAPKPTGTFDAAADTVTINLPGAALATAKVPAPTDGTTLLNLYVWSRRPAGAVVLTADRTGSLCPYTIGVGAVAPALGTTTGPDPEPKPPYVPPAPQGTLTKGGDAYSWTAGPFAAVQVPLVSGNECNGTRAGSSCDVRALTVEVPDGGATFEVVVTPSNPAADFDLHLYGPDGKRVGTSGGAPIIDSTTSTEKISVNVSQSGVYRIDVVPYTTAGHTFRGEARLV